MFSFGKNAVCWIWFVVWYFYWGVKLVEAGVSSIKVFFVIFALVTSESIKSELRSVSLREKRHFNIFPLYSSIFLFWIPLSRYNWRLRSNICLISIFEIFFLCADSGSCWIVFYFVFNKYTFHQLTIVVLSYSIVRILKFKTTNCFKILFEAFFMLKNQFFIFKFML